MRVFFLKFTSFNTEFKTVHKIFNTLDKLTLCFVAYLQIEIFSSIFHRFATSKLKPRTIYILASFGISFSFFSTKSQYFFAK